MQLLNIQARSAGASWPEILYTVPRDVAWILHCLEEKKALPDDPEALERRSGGKTITVAALPGKAYVLYLGIPPSLNEEVCAVEADGGLYYADKQLFLFLDNIVEGRQGALDL